MDLKDFQKHLDRIPKKDWERLFALIPLIEAAPSFGKMITGKPDSKGYMIMPQVQPAALVHDFFYLSHQLGIVPVFDWVNWTEGRSWVDNQESITDDLSIETLCRMLTVIYRTDRFCEGFVVSCFENGTILKILRGLKAGLQL